MGVAIVDEETIAEVLRNISLKVLDNLRTGCLVGTHDLTEVLGVESP
jgi:hypothetical protein